MSISKRKGSPYYYYSFSIEGNRYRGSTLTRERKAAAEFESKLRTKEYGALKLGRKKEQSVGVILARYWTEHAQGQSWSPSVEGYLKTFVIVWGNDEPFANIDDAKYSELVNFLKKKGLKPGTINRHMNAFRKTHRLARDVWGCQVGNINFALHRLKEPDSRVRYITDEEAARLLAHAAEHLKPIIRFALYTGVRRSNILNLKWRDVDMSAKRINFKVKSHQPGGKNHVIPMVRDLHAMLSALKKSSSANGVDILHQNVFTYNGRPIRSVKKAFMRACAKANLTDFRFHDLRHTAASWLVQNGTSLQLIQEILGHSNIRMTSKYAHHEQHQKLQAMENTFKNKVGI